MREFTPGELAEAKEAVEREMRSRRCYTVDDLEWDVAFKEVKRVVGDHDWQRAADATKEVLSEIKSEEMSEEAKKKHEQYLNSDKWKKRRRKKLQRENYKCEDCGGSASQAHHVSYENLDSADEELELRDLVALCEDCHEERHRLRGDIR